MQPLSEDIEFLAHYGVKGMQWGVRKERKQARREGRAQKFDNRAKELQGEIDALTARESTAKFYQRGSIKRQKSELKEDRDRALVDAKLKREGKLSTRQKKILKGAVAAGAIVAAYATYQAVQSGQANRMILKGKAFIQGKKAGEWVKNEALAAKDLTPDQIMSTVVKDINPDYGAIGTKVNCRRCTFAYEMRRRGNDVAATRTSSGRGQTSVGLFNALEEEGKNFVGPGASGIIKRTITDTKKEFDRTGAIKPDEIPFIKSLEGLGNIGKIPVRADGDVTVGIWNTLKGQPDGSRGEVGILYGIGGGHSMAYEIVGGKPHIFDTQSGKKYTPDDDGLFSDFGSVVVEAALTRLDNLPLNNEFMMRWLKDAS